MKVHQIEVPEMLYQQVILPNGAAPVDVQYAEQSISLKVHDRIRLYFLGPDDITPENSVAFGMFCVRTGHAMPDDLRIFPVPHPLLGTVDPPNGRYVGSVRDTHIFLGNPR